MDQPVTAPSHPRSRRPARRRHPRLAALAAVGLSLLLAGTGCSGAGARPASGAAAATGGAPAAASEVRGPLCDLLPSGTEPGNPASLAGKPPEEALQWLPVLTTFEAAVRAAGMTAELHGKTVLAPTDEAFAAHFSEDNLDKLFLADKDKLRGLLREHLVAGSLSLSDLVAAGEVTTLAGTKIKVTGGGTTARVADKADTVCADYRATDARIHIINRVLGNLPVTAGTGSTIH